jgi:hypothetical protein
MGRGVFSCRVRLLQKWCRFPVLALLMLVFFQGCRSDLNKKFYDGARRQDGLDTRTAYLWRRSPAVASGNLSIRATENFDNLIVKTPFSFSNISDLRRPIRSQDLIMSNTVFNFQAPAFFKWAGLFVPWKDNRDFRVLFAYYYLDRMIRYTDDLIEFGYLPSDSSDPNGIAWRTPVCAANDPSGHTCVVEANLEGAPVLPLHVAVDSTTLPSGGASFATDASFCSFFNVDYQFNGQPYCVARDGAGTWKSLWGNRSLVRKMMFFRDRDLPSFNYVDEADSIARNFAYVLQAAVNPKFFDFDVTQNPHLNAVIEGMADFYAAAYLRTDSVFRYTTYNIYPLDPDSYTGALRGAVRDPGNALVFPTAYLDTPQALGRVLSGAFNDIRKLMQSSLNEGGVERLPGGACATVEGCPLADPSVYLSYRSERGETAWDIALTLLYRSFYRMRASDPADLTMHSFASAVIDECVAWAPCNEAQGPGVNNVRSILEDRGLLSRRMVDAVAGVRNQQISGNTNFEHIAKLGMTIDPTEEDAADENITRRWGLVASNTLGWAPYLLGGSQEFANTDGIVSPCEVIIVFPNIQNNSDDVVWGQAPPAPPTGFPSYPAAINGWASNALSRGIDIFDLEYRIVEIPLGFDNFQHPVAGFIEPWQGLSNAAIKIIPYLQAGESTQSVVRNQSSRLYKEQKEWFFDKPLAAKVPSSSNRAKLRTPVGYIFKAPSNVGDKAILSFQISYSVYNETERSTYNTVNYIDHSAGKSIQQSVILTQSIEVEAGGGNFCD